MADSKSPKPTDSRNAPLRNTSTGPKTDPRKSASQSGSAKPATRTTLRPVTRPGKPPPRRKPDYSVKLVERKKKSPDGGKPWWKVMLEEPERIGSFVFDRPVWIDELSAIVLIVVGLVTLLSLINTSPTVALSNQWSDIIRQLVGYVGAIILSIMIVCAGVLIMLPKIGIEIRMVWMRIVYTEIGYFAFLALLHTLAHDPESRALARSGLGGGYIGWALSSLVGALFGSFIATVFFAALTVFMLGIAVGIRRTHVRKWAVSTGQRSTIVGRQLQTLPPKLSQSIGQSVKQSLAKRSEARVHVRRNLDPEPVDGPPLPAPRPNRDVPRVRPAATALDTASVDESEPALPLPIRLAPSTNSPTGTLRPVPPTGSTAAPGQLPTPSSRPFSTPVPVAPSTPIPEPLSVAINDEEELLEPIPAAPSIPVPLRAAKSVPIQKEPPPPPPPKPVRHFTVEDFKEVKQPIDRTNLPPIELLNDTELNKPTEDEINTNARVIEKTLLDFSIDVEVVDVKVGPTVTQYAVQPFREVTNDQGEVVVQRVRVNKISSLSGDLALALSAKRLRIEPYVPGHPYMGIEVPNKVPSIVALRPVMESDVFAKAFMRPDPEAPSQNRVVPLAVPLGRDVSGASVVVDLATMPHVLIAGTTGSGKSVCITALAVSLVMNNTPDRLKLVMLDPKMVELIRFNGLPHLLGPVEIDIERIIGVLRWATREMERRYKLLEAEACRNIEAYNRALGAARQAEQLPYIVIIVDEIGDMMLSRPEEMERTLTRLAQMARAVGMHLVVATQRPSVDIITGLIKANFPARISFAVASGMDSRVILDTMGAETLMGRGDMLYMAPDAGVPRRVQGCFVSDPEIEAVVNYWKRWESRQTNQTKEEPPWERAMTRREALAETDAMLEDAIDLVVREGEASTSLIQRQLGVPYPRAAHLMDLINDLGILGAPKDGGRSREVLMKPGSDPYKKLMSKYKKG